MSLDIQRQNSSVKSYTLILEKNNKKSLQLVVIQCELLMNQYVFESNLNQEIHCLVRKKNKFECKSTFSDLMNTAAATESKN